MRELGEYLIKNGIEVRSGFYPFVLISKNTKKYKGLSKIFWKNFSATFNIFLKEKDIKFIKIKWITF